MPQTGFLRKKQLRGLVPFSDVTIWRMERRGEFPKRVRLTEGGAVGWPEEEVRDWIAARLKDRRGGERPPGVAPAKPIAANDAALHP
jgi:prophage regulatory protein